VNFGLSGKGSPNPEWMVKQNIELAASAPYCLDLSEAKCTSLGFDSDALVAKVRFREKQCLILWAENLSEIAGRLFRSTKDRDLQSLLVSCLRDGACERALTLVEHGLESRLDELVAAIEGAGIDVRTTPSC
jgi:hypothetical protein